MDTRRFRPPLMGRFRGSLSLCSPLVSLFAPPPPPTPYHYLLSLPPPPLSLLIDSFLYLSNFVLVDWALKIKLLITFPTPTPSSCAFVDIFALLLVFCFSFSFILTALYIKIAHRVHCNLIVKLHMKLHALMRKIN